MSHYEARPVSGSVLVAWISPKNHLDSNCYSSCKSARVKDLECAKWGGRKKCRGEKSGRFIGGFPSPETITAIDTGVGLWPAATRNILDIVWYSSQSKEKKKGPCHWYPGRHNAINTKLQAPNWTIIRRKKGKRKRNVKKKKKPITPDHQLHLPCKINRPRGHIDDTCIAMELPIIWGRHAKFVDAERNQIVTSSVVRSSKVLEVLFGELLACLCHKVSSED